MNGFLILGIVIVLAIALYIILRIRKKNSERYGMAQSYSGGNFFDRAKQRSKSLGDCCLKGIGKFFRGGA